ncbi:MAG: hypothetical protein BIFFINMI_03827 [Phycisphaerae bacterium]|nr:hypothetical protein [Phycisphaerae bacterium]
MRRSLILVLTVVAAVPAWGVLRADDGPDASEKVILNTASSFWRWRIVRETVETVMPDGKIDHVRFTFEKDYYRKHPEAKRVADGDWKAEPINTIRLPAESDPKWMAPQFDDSTWIRAHGPMFAGSADTEWKLIQMRGRFEVTEPETAGRLSFWMSCHGGAVVYINGQEVGRVGMPEGPITPMTPALPYPDEVYLQDNGYLIWPHDHKDQYADRAKKRIRRIEKLVIPASRLRKGVNVIAVAVHRAPIPALVPLGRIERYPMYDDRAAWCQAVLFDARLSAEPGSSIEPNLGRIPGKGLVAWNQSVVVKAFPSDYPDPFAPVAPIRMTGVLNGIFAAQVILGDDEPIRGLSAKVSELSGPGTIPASAVTVRWAKPDGASPQRDKLGFFSTLEDEAPEEVPVYKESGGAVQPVWIDVAVPADAKPGDFHGQVVVTAEDREPLTLPIELRVIDWKLPPPAQMTARMDIIQSPESVARAYDVEMWSDAHWKLLDRTFALLGQLSTKTVYLTCVRRTHFGNENSMVRWKRDDEGELQPDFSIATKYLDLAIKHLGKVPGVILYCWEPEQSMGHAGGTGTDARIHDKSILITLVNDDGTLRPIEGPAWGTPEAPEFWKKLTGGMQKILADRGMADSMLLGLVGDNRPTKQAMDDISAGLKNPRWALHSHLFCDNWQGYPMGYASVLWGIGCAPIDPSAHTTFGWANPFWLNYYPRELSELSPLVDYRTRLENWRGAVSLTWHYAKPFPNRDGTHGLGRLGADFWIVVKDKRGIPRRSLAGIYPESYWGQLNLNYCVPTVLGRGAHGAVPTVRSENFRENVQEVEARTCLERAMADVLKVRELAEQIEQLKARPTDPKARGYVATTSDEIAAAEKELAAAKARPLISDDLFARCRATLDERIRMCLHCEGEGNAWFVSSGWNRRDEELFSLASEVDKALGR